MKYKLIKEYPGSPKLGEIIKPHQNSLYFVEGEPLTETFIKAYPEFWQEVVEKDYEILSLIEDKFIYLCDKYSKDYIHQLFNTIGVNIHSIKRTSDGEIFTIGDLVKCEECKGKITSLEIYGNDIYLKGLHNNMRFGYTLCKALDCDEIPQKVKQPLFTTEDGVDIFEGNNHYFYIDKNWWIDEIHNINKLNYKTYHKGKPLFSTKEKAEEYILMNKPVLSVNEVIDCFSNWSTKLTKKDWSETLKKRAQKLNNKN